MTLLEFIENYYLPYYQMEHKQSSIDLLNVEVKRLKPFFKDSDIEKISVPVINAYLGELKAKYAPSSVLRTYKSLKGIFGYALDCDVISKNPMDKVIPPKQPRKQVDAFTEDEVRTFLDIIKWQSPSLEFRTKMYLLVTTGLRRGELLGLQWQDIDFKNHEITLQRSILHTSASSCEVSTLKSENSYRTIPITPEATELLRNLHLTNKGEWVFKGRYPNTLTQEVKKFMKRNGLRDMSPHDLRHTCATFLIGSGATIKSVQDILGHAQATTTMRYYVAQDKKAMERAVSAFARI